MATRFRRDVNFLITLCILLSTFLSVAWAQEEAPIFAAPEDAIRHFVAALSENDLQKALQACDVEEYAEGYNFAGAADHLKALMPMQQLAPSEYALFAEMNNASAMGKLVDQMKMMVYSFFVPEVSKGTMMYVGSGPEKAAEFVKAVDPSKLKNLKLLRIDPPMKDMLYSEKNVEVYQKAAEINGAQELTERIALYELDGKTYLGGFSLMRYGDEWKIFRLISSLAGLSVMGTVEEITADAYASLL